ncbi:MAG: pilus assembly protein [Actinomycetes bacterium]
MKIGKNSIKKILQQEEHMDCGTAIVEFLVIGVLILVPLLYATLMVVRVEAATMASTQAVHEASRAFMMADAAAQGFRDARVASNLALADQGFKVTDDALKVTCSMRCLAPQSQLKVQLTWKVDLPWLPPPFSHFIDGYPITAEQELTMDTYRDSVDS